MLFDFAFKFNIPLLRNPFAVEPLPPLPEAPAPVNTGTTPRKPSLRPRPIQRPGVVIDHARREVSHKRRRGWEPAEQSDSTAPPVMNRTFSQGIMDIQHPAPIEEIDDIGQDQDQRDVDHPPAKRRRIGALTDTILSGALNFALVGSAVGLTAYRLWRARGIAPEEQNTQDQPPPYEDDWVKSSPDDSTVTSSSSAESRSSGTSDSHAQGARKRVKPVNRTTTTRRRPVNRPRANSRGISPVKPAQLNLDNDEMMDGGDLDESMDWMSEQLRNLIAEGQKALGKEIVIGTDTGNDDDLVDDGAEGWEDQDPVEPQQTRSMRSSYSSSHRAVSPSKRPPPSPGKRRHGHARSQSQHATPTFPYQSHAASASVTSFDRSNRSSHLLQVPPSIQAFDDLYQSTKAYNNFDDRTYAREESPDLRTAMDRVRRAYGIGQ
ncbi:hypothetical protein FRC02_000647 [Tulasnella sp. 418]|nr:hypothetical protein FRC02_000647 [Tulasnella sp. 418]